MAETEISWACGGEAEAVTASQRASLDPDSSSSPVDDYVIGSRLPGQSLLYQPARREINGKLCLKIPV
ncbi:MAG: hypothetical protein SRB2_03939 [Desulfobacteraceae bacterium Eth-SRB2]|nr:MAG: hypothetical protein SRB2_03939 [Desulfobacteraceae bacterium Eth-SRB2]